MKQITVVSQEQEGLLARITDLLAQGDINIESLEATDIGQWSLIHLSVDRYNDALVIMRDADINAVSEDAFLVDIPDAPGALANVVKQLHDANIVVHSVRILQRQGNNALIAVATEENARALALLA